jgi:hypothetical protein
VLYAKERRRKVMSLARASRCWQHVTNGNSVTAVGLPRSREARYAASNLSSIFSLSLSASISLIGTRWKDVEGDLDFV